MNKDDSVLNNNLSQNNDKQKNNTKTTDAKKIKKIASLKSRGVLLIVSKNLFGSAFPVDKEHMLIGRGSQCDIAINDISVSKEHCEIFMQNEKYFIRDRKSKNSTYLNGRVLKKPVHILYGDRIVIGNTIMRFFLEEQL